MSNPTGLADPTSERYSGERMFAFWVESLVIEHLNHQTRIVHVELQLCNITEAHRMGEGMR